MIAAATPALCCPLCGEDHPSSEGPIFSRLWVYTNYDCNLACSYCLVSSSPQAERRGWALDSFCQLIDEAVELGCEELFMTGGEPAILPHLPDMIAYALPRMHVTLLTNGLLWRGARLARLENAQRTADSKGLTLQISLDSGSPAIHDQYRGAGTWTKTVAAIQLLRERGFHVRTGATETVHGEAQRRELDVFLDELGISKQDRITRPVAKRGAAQEGLELTGADLVPELTVAVDGVYWHPVGTDEDMRLTNTVFPLRTAADQMLRLWHTISKQANPDVFR